MEQKFPAWLKEALFYEIYPQSFNDTNGDGIGDINGITEKLDYIKDLGCNAIWINPCYDSPFLDAGYDISDFYKVAPRYGTNDDLKNLFETAHGKGMHILLDLVPCHTSVNHPWFKESMKAEKNEFTDRYIWTNDGFEPPKDMESIRGISDRNGAASVTFFSHQPALNYGFYEIDRPWQQSIDDEAPKATAEELKKIMRFWLDMGADGFRVDMAHALVKNDKYHNGTITVWRRILGDIKAEYPEAAFVSEWGEAEKSIMAGFHMDFTVWGNTCFDDLLRAGEPYFSSNGNGNASRFVEAYTKVRNRIKHKGYIAPISGNHDIRRISYSLKGDELKVAFAFLLTFAGTPFIYYGDEIGMRYLDNITSKEGGFFRTGSRTPMQWNDEKNAGFSTADPEKLYLPIDPSDDRPTVEKAANDKNSLYNEIKALIKLRKANSALGNDGEIEFLSVGYPLIYKRSSETQTVTVIINPSAENEGYYKTDGRILHKIGEATLQDGVCKFGGLSAVIIEN